MEPHQHLHDMIRGFDTAMLVTCNADGPLHARPMAIASLEQEADAYLATRIESPKVHEIESDPHVLLTFQSRSQFATVEGTASVVRDQALIDRLWSDSWKIWFPGGKADPSLCMLKIEPSSAELWDNSGFQGTKYLFQGAKALLQGTTPQMDENQHAKINL